MRATTLFCLPFAGGNKYSYRGYEEAAPAHVHVATFEYPGRGRRSAEPLLTSMGAIVDDLYAKISGLASGREYAIYGHSMGALAALLLARKLIHSGIRPPLHLFVTGTIGPSAYAREGKTRHLMGKKEFIEEIIELDGMPQEILEHEELLYYFEPILRADFTASETFVYDITSPIDIPTTVITGTEESTDLEAIRSWQVETTRPVEFLMMEGGHFFILKHSREIMRIISEKLFAGATAPAGKYH